MARPKRNVKAFSVYIENESKNKLDELAAKTNLPVAYFVNEAVKQYLSKPLPILDIKELLDQEAEIEEIQEQVINTNKSGYVLSRTISFSDTNEALEELKKIYKQ